MSDQAASVSEVDRRRLRWRARRGLLENDILLSRFLDRHEHELDESLLSALGALLALPDNDLLDVLMGRTPLTGAMDTLPIKAVLKLIQSVE
ncbi:MAG TPA: succinate dehydrogenase assembly factor 2 [Burkholderiaceae bacterium]|nr:succinate dehydrogenase assembly factor 2 [Burkholderiaceae bacterium]